ncbi:MAG: transglycosylase SLT domain-containing protein [Rhodanobacter sp.]
MKPSARRILTLVLPALLAGCAGMPPQGTQRPVARTQTPAAPLPQTAVVMPGITSPAPIQDVWSKLRDSFAMSDCDADPSVLDWARRYTRNPEEFEQHLQSALPRLVYVQQVAARYDVAGEFVLLPWVESHYRPVPAREHLPAGMWQIMPVTARSMGLRVDRHYDARLDIPAAADAVMKLLKGYHDQFHDWRVADYAYNAGEFKVRKLIRKFGRPADEPVVPGWSVKPVTREHLVKLLAVACVIREPERFQVTLPALPEASRLVQAPVTGSMSLARAADLAGMPQAALRHLNPAFRNNLVDAAAAPYLILPARHAEHFRTATQQASDNAPAAVSGPTLANTVKNAANDHRIRTHVVSQGESLWQIAREYATSVARLQQLNHLQGSGIRPGDVLQLDDVD